jgi:alanine racemase
MCPVFSANKALEIVKKVKQLPYLEMEGICTHLSSSSLANEISFTQKQLTVFADLLKQVEHNGFRVPLKHAVNTGGIFAYNYPQFNLIRTGAAIYGIDPGDLKTKGLLPVKPILTLKSQVAFLKTVPAGTPVGYDRAFVTAKRTKIATIPIGYNDGYPFTLSNKGHVLIRGQKAPILGRITMDYIMVDTSQIMGVNAGDEVVLIGKQGSEEITAEEIARLCGLIPYVITCSLGKRIRRVYINS